MSSGEFPPLRRTQRRLTDFGACSLCGATVMGLVFVLTHVDGAHGQEVELKACYVCDQLVPKPDSQLAP